MDTADRPNIIFVLTDDLGYGDIGVYYQNSRDFANNRHLPAFATPNLDAMAAAGLRMDRHYTSSPVCAPARASLLSGRHQGHASVRDNQFDTPMERNHTLGTVMREAGYSTAAIGKWGLQGEAAQGWPGHPDQHGFDDFFGVLGHADAHYHYFKEFNKPLHDGRTDIRQQLDKCYSTDLFTAKAKHWITEQVVAAPEQPFFLYLAYTAPHARLEVPTMAYPEGAGLHGGLQWLDEAAQMINTAAGQIDSWIHPEYASATWDHDNNPATAEQAWPAHAKRHATMIRRLDDAMGDLIQLLEDLDIANNTLVIFTSDNGPHHEAGNGGSIAQDPRFFRTYGPLDGVKRDLWEGGIRVPTLVRWPAAIPAARVSTHPSQFHDWMATFAELAGLPSPAVSDGVSLVPDLTGEGVQAAGVVYSEYTTKWYPRTPNYSDFQSSHRDATRGHMQTVFIDSYKGVRYNVSSHETAFRIHDVAADLQETTDLSGQPGVPVQQAFRDRVLRLRRAWPGETRAYDGLPVPAVAPPRGLKGLLYRTSAGSTPWVRDVPVDEADALGLSGDGIDLPKAIAGVTGNALTIAWEGFIEVPATGTYTFRLTTDTGAVVRLHDLILIDADFAYVPGTHAQCGSLALQAGHHPIRIFSRHAGAELQLHLEWSGPGFVMESVPAGAFQTNSFDPSISPPVLTEQPEDLTLNSGQTARFSVNATGEGPLVYQWNNDGTPIPGAIYPSLVILNATPADNGAYSVTINNAGGTATSNTVFLTVIGDTQPPFNANIVAAWDLNQNSGGIRVYPRPLGTVWNQVDNASADLGSTTAALPNGVNWSTTSPAPDSSASLIFDGSQGLLNTGVSAAAMVGSGPKTFVAWVQPTAEQGTSGGAILAYTPAGSTSNGGDLRLLINAEGRLRAEVTGGYFIGSTVLTQNSWHRVAAVFDGNTQTSRLYLNGAWETISNSINRTIETAAAGAAPNFTMGMRTNGTAGQIFQPFTGRIDMVAAYTGAFGETELSEIFANGIAVQAAVQEDSYDVWSRANGISSGPEDAINGVANLMRYAFAGNADTPVSDLLPGMQSLPHNGGLHFTVSFNRISDPRVRYSLWTSEDLADWGTAPAWEESGEGLEALILDTPGSRLFIKMEVTRE